MKAVKVDAEIAAFAGSVCDGKISLGRPEMARHRGGLLLWYDGHLIACCRLDDCVLVQSMLLRSLLPGHPWEWKLSLVRRLPIPVRHPAPAGDGLFDVCESVLFTAGSRAIT